MATGLRNRGVDVVRCQEVGMIGRSDSSHLEWANDRGYVIVTQDNDFLVLHTKGFPHAGIAYITRPLGVGDIIRSLLLIHEVLTPEEMVNKIEFL